MICYASHTTTRRNLAALRTAGWRVLISAAARQHWDARGFRYCLDSGAWHYWLHHLPFDEDAFEALITLLASGADFTVLPDIAGGLASLELSIRWSNRVLATGCPLVLIAVQNGMDPEDLAPLVGPRVGVFLGGTTEWKLAEAVNWGRFCHERGIHFHFARCNTLQRFILAHDAGAASIDGSSASKFEKTLELLERGRRQGSLLDIRRERILGN